MTLRKVRWFHHRHGYEFPMIPRRIGLSMKHGRPHYPMLFYLWPDRRMLRLFDDNFTLPKPGLML